MIADPTCPNCKRTVDPYEPTCPHCGAEHGLDKVLAEYGRKLDEYYTYYCKEHDREEEEKRKREAEEREREAMDRRIAEMLKTLADLRDRASQEPCSGWGPWIAEKAESASRELTELAEALAEERST